MNKEKKILYIGIIIISFILLTIGCIEDKSVVGQEKQSLNIERVYNTENFKVYYDYDNDIICYIGRIGAHSSMECIKLNKAELGK